MDEEEIKKEVAEEQAPPRGRSASLQRYKSAYPDTAEDPDDDTLHDFSNERYSELEGKYNELNGANTKLSELVAKDPKLGAFISMIAGENPTSVPYALSKVFGKESLSLEGTDLEDFERGYKEEIESLASSKAEREAAMKNIEDYDKRLVEYGKANELSDEQIDEIHAGLMNFVINAVNGIIPNELIELIHKGLNYDKDVQEAAETGHVEGKNEAIEAKMKKQSATDGVPDLNARSGAGSLQKKRAFQTPNSSVYDNLKDIE